MQPIVYRCTRKCPINKRCFVLKVKAPLKEPIEVLFKCTAQKKEDIVLKIGGAQPP
jgi:hypothetical protein